MHILLVGSQVFLQRRQRVAPVGRGAPVLQCSARIMGMRLYAEMDISSRRTPWDSCSPAILGS